MTNHTLHNHPVVIKNTFLHIEIGRTCSRRSKSSPAILKSWVEPQKPAKKRKLPNDDDVALQEGRSMFLCDMWDSITKGLIKNKTRKVLESLETKRMKLRFSMKPDAFIQLVKIMNFNEMDIVVMRSMGMLRDPNGDVNIYLSDEQLQNECMKNMLKQADVIEGLCKANFFLMKVAADVGLAIRYDPNMTTLDLKKRAAHFYDIESDTIKLERYNGEALKGRTLRKCTIRPGDCIRVVEE